MSFEQQGLDRNRVDRKRAQARAEKVLAEAERRREKRRAKGQEPDGRRGGVAGLLRRLRGFDAESS